jgi:hypothetical protein
VGITGNVFSGANDLFVADTLGTGVTSERKHHELSGSGLAP